MNNKKSFIIICVVFVLLIGAAYLLYGKLSSMIDTDSLSVSMTQESSSKAEEQTPQAESVTSEDSEPEKISAPDFTVYDADGNAVQLSDYVGKPIVLNFWASWCGPCKMEMPDFNEKYLEKGDEKSAVLESLLQEEQPVQKKSEAPAAAPAEEEKAKVAESHLSGLMEEKGAAKVEEAKPVSPAAAEKLSEADRKLNDILGNRK